MSDLVRAFRVRALASGSAAGVVALAGVAVLRADAEDLFDGLTHRGAPLMVVSGLAGLVTITLLLKRHFAWARYTAALAVVAVLWGWAAGQYPYLLEPGLSIEDAAGAHSTLGAMLAVLGFGSVLLLPALVWLFVLVQRGELAKEQ